MMRIDKELQAVIARHVANAVAEVAALLQDRVAGAIGLRRGPGRPRKNGLAPRRAHRGGGAQIRTCIAPGCRNRSKGPRFHYLCDRHRDAPKAKWSKWAAAVRAQSGP